MGKKTTRETKGEGQSYGREGKDRERVTMRGGEIERSNGGIMLSHY